MRRTAAIAFVVATISVMILPVGCSTHPSSTRYGRLSISPSKGAVTIVDRERPSSLWTIERPHVHFRIFDVFNALNRRTDNVWIESDVAVDWNQFKAIAMTDGKAVVLHERFTPKQPNANSWPDFFISETDGELPEPASACTGEFTPEFTHVVYQFTPAGVLWADYDGSNELVRIGAANQTGSVHFHVDLEKKWGTANPFTAYDIPRHFDPANGAPPINSAMRHGMTSIRSGREWPTGSLEGCFVLNRSAHLAVVRIRSFSSEGQPLGQESVRYRTRPYDREIADVYWGGLPNKVGPANRSQPIRSETNRTSSEAGSDR